MVSISSYDHLSKLLTKILNERPNDAVDILEDLSKQQKRERFVNQVDTLLNKPEKSTESKLADIQKSLFMVTITTLYRDRTTL
jgi:radial spoke head protein 4A